MHECRDHDGAIFATITYNDAHVHPDGALVPSHLSEFFRKLRKAVRGRKTKSGIKRPAHVLGNDDQSPYHRQLRYVACGEYGDRSGRPHYHAILFGVAFSDAQPATSKLLNSRTLEKLWGRGTVNYGEVTRASAAYVAGYTVKSLGKLQHSVDGVSIPRPFLRVSTHPGIGARYAERFATDFRTGTLVVDGDHQRIPRYYRKRITAHAPDVAAAIVAAIELRQAELEATYGDPKTNPAHPSSRQRLMAGSQIQARSQELTRSHTL